MNMMMMMTTTTTQGPIYIYNFFFFIAVDHLQLLNDCGVILKKVLAATQLTSR